MKKNILISSLLLLVLLSITGNSAYALSGPTGLNQIRTEAGPNSGQITINWQRYDSSVTGYSIMYGTSSGKYQYGTGNIGNVATYTIGSLQPGVRYYFRLYPYINGTLSDPRSGEFSDIAISTPHTVVGTSGPYGQRKLKVTQGPEKGSIILSWSKLYPDVDNYHIVYGVQPGKYIYGAQNLGDATNGSKSYTVKGLTSGTRYYFAVTPSRGGVSLYDSAEVSIVAP